MARRLEKRGERRSAEAEPYLFASAGMLDSDARHSNKTDVYANLAAYYTAVGRPTDAARFR